MHLKTVRLLHENYPTHDHYPFNLSLFQKTTEMRFNSPISFFIGENGTGKSTLLNAIARKARIHIWEAPPVRRIERNPYEQLMYRVLELDWFNDRVPGSYFGSQIFNYFTYLLEEWAVADPGIIEYFGGHSLLTVSHGQSLLAFFRARYHVKGLYLLDEPETALSPQSQLELMRILKRTGEQGAAQFVIATHSPILLATPGAQIFSFDAAPINVIPYKDTQYFKLYRKFMNNPAAYFKEE